MTPLAHSIAKDLCLPAKKRIFEDRTKCNFASQMNGSHCFEVTKIQPLIFDLFSKPHNLADLSKFTFLPAGKTWVEWRQPDGSHIAVLFVQHGNEVDVFIASDAGEESIAAIRVGAVDMVSKGNNFHEFYQSNSLVKLETHKIFSKAVIALIFINTGS